MISWKIVKFPEDADLMIKSVTETVKNEVKKQKGGFLGMLAAILGASLLGIMLAGKGVVRGGDGIIRAGEEVIRAGEEKDF